MERRLAAIFAADVVGYGRLMGMDETGTLRRLSALRRELVQPCIERRRGRVIKLMGDGLLAEFPSVVEAVTCAAEIQREMRQRETALPEQKRIKLRIGVNLGDIIIAGSDIYGDGVNIAARLEAIAEPEGVCISGAAFDAVDGKIDIQFEDIGPQQLKNIDKPIRVFRMMGRREQRDAHAAPLSGDISSIAILPFTNMSGDKDQEYFSDGITEDIITDLSKLSNLLVISRKSTFSYKGKDVSIQKISSDLGVKYVVEGSIRKSGNRVRVTAQLIDTASGGHIWAERYDRELTDVFSVQDDISRNIVDSLEIAISPRERSAIAKTHTQNVQAYEYYLRGRNFVHSMTKRNLERARRLFARAIELDPSYTLALTGIADCESYYYSYYSSDRIHIDTALDYSRRALKIDPELAEAHAAEGLALSNAGDNAGAEAAFQRAIELDPMLYEAYWYFGLHSVKLGEFERAREMFDKASRVRGDDLQSMMMLLCSLQGLEQTDEAARAAHRTVESANRHLDLNPSDAQAAYTCASAFAYLNKRDDALRLANLAAELDPGDTRTSYNLACTFSMLGQTDRALQHLEYAIKHGRPIRMIDWAKIDPDLEFLRKDQRYWDLLRLWEQVDKDQQEAGGPSPEF